MQPNKKKKKKSSTMKFWLRYTKILKTFENYYKVGLLQKKKRNTSQKREQKFSERGACAKLKLCHIKAQTLLLVRCKI